jgi:hypothetical protein
MANRTAPHVCRRRSRVWRSRCQPEHRCPYSPHPEPCTEIDRPSWQPGSSPPRLTPITLPAASRLPLVPIGAAGSADSMSARAIVSPLQMPDIRLQAHPTCRNNRSASCRPGGVHIRRVRRHSTYRFAEEAFSQPAITRSNRAINFS